MAASVRSEEFSDSETLAGGLRIEVIKRVTTTTVALWGEWDFGARATAEQVFRGALAGQPEHLVLDLRNLSFMDASGVHSTVDLARRSAALNVRLAIVGGPEAVQRVFDVCQLTECLPFMTTSETLADTPERTARGPEGST